MIVLPLAAANHARHLALAVVIRLALAAATRVLQVHLAVIRLAATHLALLAVIRLALLVVLRARRVHAFHPFLALVKNY